MLTLANLFAIRSNFEAARGVFKNGVWKFLDHIECGLLALELALAAEMSVKTEPGEVGADGAEAEGDLGKASAAAPISEALGHVSDDQASHHASDDQPDGEKAAGDDQADGEKAASDDQADGEKAASDDQADGEKAASDDQADGETAAGSVASKATPAVDAAEGNGDGGASGDQKGRSGPSFGLRLGEIDPPSTPHGPRPDFVATLATSTGAADLDGLAEVAELQANLDAPSATPGAPLSEAEKAMAEMRQTLLQRKTAATQAVLGFSNYGLPP